MRKLASVRRIDALTPIPDADKIELAKIDGWQVIVQKGLHEVGKKVVYFEIDSVLPIKPEYEFLRKSSYVSKPDEGFRIKTMKMRGQISQGLVMPYNGLAPIGTDLTAEYGVVLYNPPVPVSSSILGHWPNFIAKTDQERVQNLLEVPREDYEVTTKYDGTSTTVYINRGQIGICSRNYELVQEGTYWDAAADVVEALKQYGGNYAVQGELMGPGIQGNSLGLSTPTLFVFDVWNINTQSYMFPDERAGFIAELNLEIGGQIQEVEHFIDWHPGYVDSDAVVREKIVQMADIVVGGKVQEGLVFKSYESATTFKAINNRYLLKEK